MQNEIRLNHAELATLLDTVQALNVMGLEQARLFPSQADQRAELLRQGHAALQKRGQCGPDGQFHPDLLRLAWIIGFPWLVMHLIHRDPQTFGPKPFLFYLSPQGMVELFLHKEGGYQLALLSDPAELLLYVLALLAPPEHSASRPSLDLAQEAFFQCSSLALQGQHSQAQVILQQAGLPQTDAEALIQALARPEARAGLTLLKCADQTIVDARDLTLLTGSDTCWGVRQLIPGQPLLHIEAVNTQALWSLLLQWTDELEGVS